MRKDLFALVVFGLAASTPVSAQLMPAFNQSYPLPIVHESPVFTRERYMQQMRNYRLQAQMQQMLNEQRLHEVHAERLQGSFTNSFLGLTLYP